MSRNAVASGIVILVLLAVGLYGVFRPGPKPGERPELVAEKLNAIPHTIGPWVGVDRKVSETALRGAEAQAHLYRDYRHETTREVVSVLVLYGEPAALGAHTPQVCYSATGYDPCGVPEKLTLPERETGGPTELWLGRFERERGKEALEVAWGWGVNGVWGAVENPRFSYAEHRLIFKIYAQQSATGRTPRPPTEPNTLSSFLTLFIKGLNLAVIDRTQ
jgi:Protein of unknown function (DUF3485)